MKDVDFDQAEDLLISPAVESSLIFFDFPASSFQEPTGTAVVVEQDELELDLFNEEFVRDNLVRAELFFEVTNSIDRNFRADIVMFDANGGITNSFDITVMPDGNNEVVVTHTELFIDTSLDQLKNTMRIQVTLSMFPSPAGIPLDDTSLGNIKMRSKATLFFEIDTE